MTTNNANNEKSPTEMKYFITVSHQGTVSVFSHSSDAELLDHLVKLTEYVDTHRPGLEDLSELGRLYGWVGSEMRVCTILNQSEAKRDIFKNSYPIQNSSDVYRDALEKEMKFICPSVTIEEHWDTSGIISGDSDPKVEFELWEEFAKSSPDWIGLEFTVEDFSECIDGCKWDEKTAHQ